MTEAPRSPSNLPFAASALIWIVLLGGSAYFADDLEGNLWILSELWWLGLWVAGLVVGLWGLVRLVRGPRRLATAAGLVLFLAAGAGVHSQGETLREARLRSKLPGYQAVVTRIQASGRGAGLQSVNGVGCNIDPGPPLRVAFRQPGGLLDNYRAVVYDPTGLVMQANIPGSSAIPRLVPRAARTLFGGDLIWAEPLGGPWYLCGFT